VVLVRPNLIGGSQVDVRSAALSFECLLVARPFATVRLAGENMDML